MDAAAARGTDLGRLHGVPIVIKDLRNRKVGIRHTMGLAPLAENIAQTDSMSINPLGGVTCVVRWRDGPCRIRTNDHSVSPGSGIHVIAQWTQSAIMSRALVPLS